MTKGALLCSGVIIDHDLALLPRTPRYLFMTNAAIRPRIRWDGKLQVDGMNRTGRCVDVARIGVPAAAGAMTDFAFDHFANVGTVMDAFGPSGVLNGVAGFAIRRSLELGLVLGDFRNRIAAIMPKLVKGLVD